MIFYSLKRHGFFSVMLAYIIIIKYRQPQEMITETWPTR